jgi:hypothetical protein
MVMIVRKMAEQGKVDYLNILRKKLKPNSLRV